MTPRNALGILILSALAGIAMYFIITNEDLRKDVVYPMLIIALIMGLIGLGIFLVQQ